MSGFGFEEDEFEDIEDSKIMTIQQVLEELKKALNEYAEATSLPKNEKKLANVKNLRLKIRNIISSYQPDNEQEGIFDDIISLLSEEDIERFKQVQLNILSDEDTPISINTEDMNTLAKYFLLGKAGFKLMYENTKENLNNMIENSIDKIVNGMSKIPAIPIYNGTLSDFVEATNVKSTKNISVASSKISDCKETINKTVKSFVSFIDRIKNTVDQLFTLTLPEYQHEIWGDRSKYVNEDGTLVDPVEQIRLNMIIDYLNKNKVCRRATTLPYNQGIHSASAKNFYKTKTTLKRPSTVLGLGPKTDEKQQLKITYPDSDTEDENSQGTLKLDTEDENSEYSPPPYYSDDEQSSALTEKTPGTKRKSEFQIEPSLSKKPTINTGGKTKKNKRKSKKVKRKSKKVKRKSGRNRRSKRKTRVKK